MRVAPAVTRAGNRLKQLHRRAAQLRTRHSHRSLLCPPHAGGGLQPRTAALPSPDDKIPRSGPGRSRRADRRGSLITLCPPPNTGRNDQRKSRLYPHTSLHIPKAANGVGRAGRALTLVQQQLLQGVPPLESFLRRGPAGEGQRVGNVTLPKPRSQHEQNVSSR